MDEDQISAAEATATLLESDDTPGDRGVARQLHELIAEVRRRDALVQWAANVKTFVEELVRDENETPTLRDLIRVVEVWSKGTCRYCSWCLSFAATGANADEQNAELRDHMLACERHPMNELRGELATARESVAVWVSEAQSQQRRANAAEAERDERAESAAHWCAEEYRRTKERDELRACLRDAMRELAGKAPTGNWSWFHFHDALAAKLRAEPTPTVAASDAWERWRRALGEEAP